jgi:NAD-dependent deacetylase
MSRNIVVLTGAGISKESGLDTFRDADGIWSTVRVEDVATPEAFEANPARVLDFYNMRRRGLLAKDIAPNAAHLALAQLEREWPDEVLIVTQNIDNLHERAGSRNLIHMHGELLKAWCLRCSWEGVIEDDFFTHTPCPSCDEAGGLRPKVVWFGEMPLDMDRIYRALETCELFISIGTSGNVYPAAGFVQVVNAAGGAHTVELSLEPSDGASQFAEAGYGPATQLVPAFVEKVLDKGW